MTADSFPEPNEGMTGTPRPDLSLTDDITLTRDSIRAIAKALTTTCLVGHRAPAVTELWERISHPQIGDLVVETTSRSPMGVGYYLGSREEWMITRDEDAANQAEYGDEPRTTDTYHYVQYGPNPQDVCRWYNCSFTAIPTGA